MNLVSPKQTSWGQSLNKSYGEREPHTARGFCLQGVVETINITRTDSSGVLSSGSGLTARGFCLQGVVETINITRTDSLGFCPQEMVETINITRTDTARGFWGLQGVVETINITRTDSSGFCPQEMVETINITRSDSSGVLSSGSGRNNQHHQY
ncbi:hypothetical protein RRG08_058212 [Elysia crispata]|uniref:Uncharacterized protein n=1 Tax=Elysia crispata TaxID=231223 RepID=A0AAE1D0D5_9GAST|nr:hypothetical protein RRG08_058212 [Elysia crispata]